MTECCTRGIQLFEHTVSTVPRQAADLPIPRGEAGEGREPRSNGPWRTIAAAVGFVLLGAGLGAAWQWRDRVADVAGPWWFVALPFAVLSVLTAFVRTRPRPPKSPAHPAMLVRRSPHWNYRPVMRPLGRRGLVPNVFVDGDSFAEAAWPGADLTVSRRWTVDASERVASRFGTEVAVVLGVGATGAAGREHVRVVAIQQGSTMRDALWELIAPVDPQIPILFVTDDEQAARAALAHGVQLMPCRGWMNLADRLVAAPDRSVGAA